MMPLILGPIVLGLAGALDTYSTQVLIQRLAGGKHTGSPRLKPGDIGAAALQISKLSKQGLQPVVTTDFETGNLIVGTRDQNVYQLAHERNVRLATTPSTADLRQAGYFEAVERARGNATPSPGIVMAPSAAISHDVVGRPGAGQVVRGQAATSSRGGPCAGAESAFQRIRCNLGGLA